LIQSIKGHLRHPIRRWFNGKAPVSIQKEKVWLTKMSLGLGIAAIILAAIISFSQVFEILMM
jgi:hypothetical protein